MLLHFLEAADGTPLAKRFRQTDTGIEKESYPNVYGFNSYNAQVSNPAEFHAAVTVHGQRGHCLLKGHLTRDLADESRAGATDLNKETQWLCLDVDGLQGISSAEQFVQQILPPEFRNVTYVEQASASAGIFDNDTYNGHLFFMLNQPVTAGLLKLWTQKLNFDNETLRNGLTLARNSTTLKWKLDITVNQNDKLIYIADPICEGFADPVSGQRILLQQKENDFLTINIGDINPAVLRQREHNQINALREDLGLPKKTPSYKTENGVQYLANPDPAELVAAPFTERGFVYLPMNPGNRYTYYHPIDDPRFIYSFRGEPPMRTRDVLPQYWDTVKDLAQERDAVECNFTGQDQISYVLCRSELEDKYLEFRYQNDAIIGEYSIGSKDKLADRFKELGRAVPEYVPTWNVKYDPQDTTVVDAEARVINRFKSTEYMRNARRLDTVPAVPSTILNVLRSVTGNCDETLEHLLNWMAVKFQTRDKIGTAWVMQGVQGTGKGLLFHQIMAPLLGEPNTAMVGVEQIEDQFNAIFANKLFVAVDEVEFSGLDAKTQRSLDKLKNMITEPLSTIRAMRTDAQNIKSYLDLFFFSNAMVPIRIPSGDRRHNICPRQETPLRAVMDVTDITTRLESELSDFADYLATREANKALAQVPLDNEARRLAIEDSKSGNEVFFAALIEGNLQYFYEETFLDQDTTVPLALTSAKSAVQAWARRQRDDTQAGRVTTEELLTVLRYMNNGSALSKKAFGALLKRFGGFHPTNIRVDGTVKKGITVNWQADDMLLQRIINGNSDEVIDRASPPAASPPVSH